MPAVQGVVGDILVPARIPIIDPKPCMQEVVIQREAAKNAAVEKRKQQNAEQVRTIAEEMNFD